MHSIKLKRSKLTFFNSGRPKNLFVFICTRMMFFFFFFSLILGKEQILKECKIRIYPKVEYFTRLVRHKDHINSKFLGFSRISVKTLVLDILSHI